MFVLVEKDNYPGIRASFGEVEEGDAFITHVSRDVFMRFKFDGDDDEDFDSYAITKFVERFRMKAVDPFYVSEPAHKEPLFLEDSQVERITGNQYREKVIRSKEAFFVLLCSGPEVCSESINTMKLLDNENSNKTALRFAYVNIEKNEIPGVSVTKTPSFLLYIHPYKGKPKVFELDNKIPVISGWLNTYVPGLKLDITPTKMFKNFYESSTVQERLQIKQFLEERNYTVEDVSPEVLREMVQQDEELKIYISTLKAQETDL